MTKKEKTLDSLQDELDKLIIQHGIEPAEGMYLSLSPAYSDEEDGNFYLIESIPGCDSKTVVLGETKEEALRALKDFFKE